jgi:hypothetical protein
MVVARWRRLPMDASMSGAEVITRSGLMLEDNAMADGEGFEEEADDEDYDPGLEMAATGHEYHEYDEDDNSDCAMDVDDLAAEHMDDKSDAMSSSSNSSELYRTFLVHLEEPAEIMKPERQEDALDGDRGVEYEHVAGSLACEWLDRGHGADEGAFNGHAISAEQMRGCNTLQCFIKKHNDEWRPEHDDQPFELSGQYFLSGLTDRSPSRDVDSEEEVYPARHSCSWPRPDNDLIDYMGNTEFAMPFHPACLEVFKRASAWRFGHIDYEGLINWWMVEASRNSFLRFPRDPAVNYSQWYEHEKGNEFVAANPCFATGMESILNDTDKTHDAAFGHSTPVFQMSQQNAAKSLDPFASLSPELRLMILDLIDSADIASLRLVSRTFCQLPQSLFRSLTLRELPWLWEAWSDMAYSKWAYPMAAELRRHDQQIDARIHEMVKAQITLAEESRVAGIEDKQLNHAASKALQQAIANEQAKRGHFSPKAHLRASEKTDWYQLRCALARNKTHLLGLRNRRRIWKDCEEILDRIERLRAEGTMVVGEMLDPIEMAAESRRRVVEHNQRWSSYCAAGRPGDFEDWR